VRFSDWRTLFPIENREDVGRFGTDARVCVSFRKEDGVVLVDDEGGGEWEAPTGFGGVVIAEAGVVEGDIDQNGLVIASEVLRDGVGYAESLCDGGTGIGEQRVLQAVLF
jgi:hypothetical protein